MLFIFGKDILNNTNIMIFKFLLEINFIYNKLFLFVLILYFIFSLVKLYLNYLNLIILIDSILNC